MTTPAEDPRGGDDGYRCGARLPVDHATLVCGRKAGHDGEHRCTRADGSMTGWADIPPAAGRGDTDSGGEETPQPPECRTCGKRQWPVIHSCTGIPAARPAGDRAQPTQEVREAIARTLFESDRQAIDGGAAPWDDEIYGDGLLGLRTAYRQSADALLAGPLAALLDAQAAVGRVRAALRAALTESGLVAPVHIATGKVYDALDGTT